LIDTDLKQNQDLNIFIKKKEKGKKREKGRGKERTKE
jgi:hypothetical protein